MSLSGTQVAYKQARAGIERAGASRAGFFRPNLVVLIAGVNRTLKIDKGTLTIEQNLNDEPDTARFTLLPTAGFIPNEGEEVIIGLGTSAYREFGGQVLRKTHRRRSPNQTPWIDVECIDYQRLFDRRLVTTQYTAVSATTIVEQVIDGYTSGFTRVNVAQGLPTIDFLPLINVPPSQVLRRVATLIGGGFYIDAHRDVHVFGADGENGPRAPTAPIALTNLLTSLVLFAHEKDLSQVRTRVTVEGQSTTCPISTPESTTVAASALVDYLIVAGGGFGGTTVSTINGGGGGGGVREGSLTVTSIAYAITVGAGGATSNTNGADSSAFGLTAIGGGAGRGDSGSGAAGGSGGAGCGNRPVPQNGGAGTSGQGYVGGTGGYYFDTGSELFFDIGGGGGGAGGAGGNADVNLNDVGRPGAGGIGRLSSISGTPTYYGGGGAGFSFIGTASGGLGGGGNAAVAGTNGLGGGGGAIAAGGSGVVVISYPTGSLSATGGTITTVGARTIHTFTSSGTLTVSATTIPDTPPAITDLPLNDASKIADAAGTVRIGTQITDYVGTAGPTVAPGANLPGTKLTADVALLATTLSVEDVTIFTDSTGWVKVGDQIVRYSAKAAGTPPAGTLTIPSIGFGALQGPVSSGTQVTWLPSITLSVSGVRFSPALAADTDVVQRVTVDDAAAQAVLAAREGGDGVHEHPVSDANLDKDGCTARGFAELNAFSAAPTTARWQTRDMNARPGCQQIINLSADDTVVDTLTITRAAVTLVAPNYRPLRTCEATTTKAARVLDELIAKE